MRVFILIMTITIIVLSAFITTNMKNIETFVTSIIQISHEIIANIDRDHEIFIGQILATKDFTITSTEPMRICSTPQCTTSFEVGNVFPGYLVESFKQPLIYNVKIRLVIEDTQTSSNVSEILQRTLNNTNNIQCFITASREFKDNFKIHICDNFKSTCRFVPWSNNASIPDVLSRIDRCAYLTFVQNK